MSATMPATVHRRHGRAVDRLARFNDKRLADAAQRPVRQACQLSHLQPPLERALHRPDRTARRSLPLSPCRIFLANSGSDATTPWSSSPGTIQAARGKPHKRRIISRNGPPWQHGPGRGVERIAAHAPLVRNEHRRHSLCRQAAISTGKRGMARARRISPAGLSRSWRR